VTSDAVAVCALAPDEAMTIAALATAAPSLNVEQGPDNALHLYDDDGRWWCTVDPPVLVQVEGEADRLLGSGPPVPCPGWWVECRADPALPEAVETGRSLARALAHLGRGTVWRTSR
jgi:hypothetical protein